MEVTTTLRKKVFCQKQFDKFVNKEIKGMTKLRDRKHRDWLNVTDEKIKELAESMAKMYGAGYKYEDVKTL